MSPTESTSYDADEWRQYRSLSTLAVIAFVLGLCSLLAFVSPLMLVVPLAAVATALLALKGIAASEGGLSGAKLARLGLALAILFTIASFARVKVRDVLLQRQADRAGRQWLSLAAQSRSEDMMELMTKEAAEKFLPTNTAQQQTSFFGGIFATAMMRQDPLVVRLSEMRGTGEIRLELKDASIVATGQPPEAFLRYITGNAESEQQDCLMVLKRFQASDSETIWLIDSWALE